MTLTIQNQEFKVTEAPVEMKNGIYMGIVEGIRGAQYNLFHNVKTNLTQIVAWRSGQVVAETEEIILV